MQKKPALVVIDFERPWAADRFTANCNNFRTILQLSKKYKENSYFDFI